MNNTLHSLIIIALLFNPTTIIGQMIFGKVIDSDSQEPVPFANIQIVGTMIGTACNEEGEFVLTILSDIRQDSLKVSCIGYSNAFILIQELGMPSPQILTIELNPFTQLLNDVTVTGIRQKPEEFLGSAVDAIPKNYIQKPFNMEFYSNLNVQDSSGDNLYQLESIMLTYKEGYTKDSYNVSKAIHRRETGDIPNPFLDYVKDDSEYFPYWSGISITGMDQVGLDYSVFNKKNFKKMNFRYAGVSKFDEDTVVAIKYKNKKNDKMKGTVYVASNNLAFIKHTYQIGSRTGEIIYKNYNGFYYPYLIKSKYPVLHDPTIFIIDEVSLMKIEIEEVILLQQEHDHWFPKGVAYDEEYWNLNRPQRE